MSEDHDELALFLCGHSKGKVLVWRAGEGGGDRLTNPDPTQAQIQAFELAHRNTYLICELLEHVKGWSYRGTIPQDLHDFGQQQDT